MNANTSFVKRHSLVLFFVLAYAPSWGNNVLGYDVAQLPLERAPEAALSGRDSRVASSGRKCG